MANFQKFNKAQSGGILEHDQRILETNKKDGSYIDPGDKALNYRYPGFSEDPLDIIKMYGAKKLNRKDVNLIISCVITLPKDVKEEDTKKFFESANRFMRKEVETRSSVDATVGGYVHLDETAPHLHFTFVPLVPSGKGGLKVSAKEWLTKDYLQKFHERLNETIKHDLGYEVSIITGETSKRGNKSLVAYKRMQEAKLKELDETISEKKDEIETLEESYNKDAADNEELCKVFEQNKAIFEKQQELIRRNEQVLKGQAQAFENLGLDPTKEISNQQLKNAIFKDL